MASSRAVAIGGGCGGGMVRTGRDGSSVTGGLSSACALSLDGYGRRDGAGTTGVDDGGSRAA